MERVTRAIKVHLSQQEFNDYLSFIKRVIEENYRGRIRYSLDAFHGSNPCVVIGLIVNRASIEIQVVANSTPWYSLTYDPYLTPRSLVDLIERLLENATYLFAETKGKGVLYYVIVPGLDVVPLRSGSVRYKLIHKLLTGNLVFMFAISLAIYLIAWLLVKHYAPLVILATQIVLLLLSDRIVALMGDWKLGESSPYVYLIGLRIPLEVYTQLVKKVLYPKRYEIKRKIYRELMSKNLLITPDDVSHLLYEYGVYVDTSDIVVKRVNLFSVVREVFERYDLPLPKVVLSNIVLPNAAASGVFLRNTTLLVTSGLLTKLNEDEVKAVIAHEASHLKNRDPLILNFLIIAEYLLRVYIFLTFMRYFNVFLEVVYLYVSLTALFFLAKFIEARADIEATVRLGDPQPLISALKKIGARRLMKELTPVDRLSSWLNWNPHPPLSFRIEKLHSLSGKEVKNLWFEAISSCLSDFMKTLSSMLRPQAKEHYTVVRS
mgnify:CR=1 FL=1